MKNNYLSHGEQNIYFALKPGQIYDIDFIASSVGIKRRILITLLSRMARKGWITRLKRGKYLVNSATGAGSNDYFSIATMIFGGYLGFSSALYVYGAMDESPYTIYVCTRNKSATTTMQNTEIKAVALGRRATGMTYFNGYFVSSKAKTLYDCFYMPRFSGGYSNVLAAVNRLDFGKSDWKDFIFYVKRFGNPSFSRKTGFLLWLLNENSPTKIVPENVLDELNTGKKIVKIGKGTKGKFNKKWGIVNYIAEDDVLGKIPWKK
jgi:predicted transcriptional regulator of viral defense system